jgi:TonB family protein
MRKLVPIGVAVVIVILVIFCGFSLADGTKQQPKESIQNQQQQKKISQGPKPTLPIQSSQDPNQPIQLSDEQRDQWDGFFTGFSNVDVQPFASGKISDDELIHFGLRQIKGHLDWRHEGSSVKIASKDVDIVTNEYFGKVAACHHSLPNFPFRDGYYETGLPEVGGSTFSKLQNIYDNGDGTYAAIVYVYASGYPAKGFKGLIDNGDGTYTAMGIYVDEQGNEKKWYQKDGVHLNAEYKAVVKAVCEGGNKKYILVEYTKERDFRVLRDGNIYRWVVPNPLPKEDHQDIYTHGPVYPPDAINAGREGSVMVQLGIDVGGMVNTVEIIQSSGYTDLDEAVEQAVKLWRLSPATKDGVPVTYTETIRFQFIKRHVLLWYVK